MASAGEVTLGSRSSQSAAARTSTSPHLTARQHHPPTLDHPRTLRAPPAPPKQLLRDAICRIPLHAHCLDRPFPAAAAAARFQRRGPLRRAVPASSTCQHPPAVARPVHPPRAACLGTAIPMSEHSAKRQRLTGSFSPASPPYHLSAKPLDHQTKPVVQPNTPTSPPYPPMSSRNNGAPSSASIAPTQEMTPPSSVSFTSHQQTPQHTAGPQSHASLLATPKSLAGTFSSSLVDSDGDIAMDSLENEGAAANDEHRRSDHERQRRAVSGGPAAGSQLFSLCQKCKVPFACSATLSLARLTRTAA